MIGRLTGKVVQEDDDFVLVLDVGGVGYDVHAPLGTRGRAHAEADGRITLHIHTHVREDILALYGFASVADRAAFRALLSVTSIGPKSAISILSVLPAGELARAIEQQEVKMLTSISGVGKKTAERILLELQGKIAPQSGATKATPRTPAKGPSLEGQALSVYSALLNLGYKAPEAERAVLGLGAIDEAEDLSLLLRKALASLTK